MFITPYKVSDYFLNRLISSSAIMVAGCLLLACFARGTQIDFLLFLVGIISASLLFSILGIGVAAGSEDTSHFFAWSAACLALFSVPLLRYFMSVHPYLFLPFPGYGPSVFVWSALGTKLEWDELLRATVNMVFWMLVGWKWAYQRFFDNIILNSKGAL